MKKLLAVVLSLALVFSLTACGAKKGKVESKQGDKKTEKKVGGKEITGKKLIKNVHARKAIAYAIEKGYIVDTIIATGSLPVDYFIPKQFTKLKGKDFRDFAPDGWIHADKDKAQKEWELAKKDLGFETATLELLMYDKDTSKKIAEYVQNQLETKLKGLKVKVNQQPFKNKIKLARDGKFEMEYAGWVPDYPDPMTFLDMWQFGNGQNTMGFNNKEYNKIIDDTKSGSLAAKTDERWKALQRAEEILVKDETVLVPVMQRGLSFLQKPYIKGIARHTFGAPSIYKAATTKEINGKKLIRLTTMEDVPTFDSTKSSNILSFEVISNTQENLVMLDEKDNVIPGVAEKWEVSKDGKKYTFHLRDSKWSNGEPVTANDFVYAFQRLADPNTRSQYQFMIETVQVKNYKDVMAGKKKPTELGISALNPKTVVIELEQPVPYFLKTITLANFAPLNKKFVESKGENYSIGAENLLYNGAYTIKNIKNGYGYEFVKNPKYWDVKNVKNDGVTYRIIKDVSAGVNLYNAGTVDLTGLSGEYKEEYQDSKEYVTHPTAAAFYFIFNVGNEGKKANK